MFAQHHLRSGRRDRQKQKQQRETLPVSPWLRQQSTDRIYLRMLLFPGARRGDAPGLLVSLDGDADFIQIDRRAEWPGLYRRRILGDRDFAVQRRR